MTISMKKKPAVHAKQKKVFIEAMGKTFGNISASCRSAEISRGQYYAWIESDPSFKEQVESNDYSESFKDTIESKLAKLAFVDENPTVLIFLAKTKCKDRGYVERIESTGRDGKDLIPARILSKDEARDLLKNMDNEY